MSLISIFPFVLFLSFKSLPHQRNQCSRASFALNSLIDGLYLQNIPRPSNVTMLAALFNYLAPSVSRYYQLFSVWNIMVYTDKQKALKGDCIYNIDMLF